MSKSYIILTSDLRQIGGMQCYVAGKADYLKKSGWRVNVFYGGYNKFNRRSPIPSLFKYVQNRIPELTIPPFFLYSWHRSRVLDRIEREIGRLNWEFDILESQDDVTSQWGELISERLGCKHVITLLNEVYRGDNKFYEPKIDFYKFKLERAEILGGEQASCIRNQQCPHVLYRMS